VSLDREQPEFFDNAAQLVVLRADWRFLENWESLVELRTLDLSDLDLPPLMLRKKDEATLYSTRDLAAAIYRHETYQFDRLLYVVGQSQELHFKQLFEVLRRMGFSWADRCEHVMFGWVKFKDQHLSSREGNVVLLDEVLHRAIELVDDIMAAKNPDLENRAQVAREVGVGAVIFADLATRRIRRACRRIPHLCHCRADRGQRWRSDHAVGDNRRTRLSGQHRPAAFVEPARPDEQ